MSSWCLVLGAWWVPGAWSFVRDRAEPQACGRAARRTGRESALEDATDGQESLREEPTAPRWHQGLAKDQERSTKHGSRPATKAGPRIFIRGNE